MVGLAPVSIRITTPPTVSQASMILQLLIILGLVRSNQAPCINQGNRIAEMELSEIQNRHQSILATRSPLFNLKTLLTKGSLKPNLSSLIEPLAKELLVYTIICPKRLLQASWTTLQERSIKFWALVRWQVTMLLIGVILHQEMAHLIMAIQVILESSSSVKDELQALTVQSLIRTSQIREVELSLELVSHDRSS